MVFSSSDTVVCRWNCVLLSRSRCLQWGKSLGNMLISVICDPVLGVFENTHLEFKEKYLGNKRIDSDANLLGDILVGFAGLWGTAYILKAAVA